MAELDEICFRLKVVATTAKALFEVGKRGDAWSASISFIFYWTNSIVWC